MQQVEKNKVISLSYELRFDNENGELIEKIEKDKPMSFLYGSDLLLNSFENHLKDKKVDEEFDFILSPDEAYGDFSEDAIVDIPKKAFEVNGKIDHELLFEGNYIPMSDEEGNELRGIVTEIGEDTVTMDFNHPLAGEDLYFKGKILDIRDATEEEINKGFVEDPLMEDDEA